MVKLVEMESIYMIFFLHKSAMKGNTNLAKYIKCICKCQFMLCSVLVAKMQSYQNESYGENDVR